MLTEKNLASADKELSKLYKEIEARILCDIAKTLKAISATTDAQLYQAKILQELGAIRSRVNQYMKKYDKAIQKEVQAIFEKAMKDAMKNDVRAFGKAKGAMSDNQKQLYENLQSQIESVQANSDIANKTFGAIKNLTQSIARGAQKEFIDVANRAFLETATGAFSHTEALKHATNELAEKGIRTIEYQRGGKKINRTIEGAIRENIITGINQASSEQTLRNAALLEVERFQVTSHFGSRPEHEVWQGKIFTKQELYEVCGLGTATGLCGINCRHSYYPYIEGMNGFYSDSDIEAMNEKTVHYKGEQLSQYEAEQKQRAIERSIRKYKTCAMVEASAGLDNTKARAMLGEKQNEMRAFIKETELPREASREHVGNTGAQVRGIKSKILSVDLKFFEKGDIANEENNNSKLLKLYDKPNEYRSLYTQLYKTQINKHKQDKHIASNTINEKSTTSYFKNSYEELEKIVKENIGKGNVQLTKRHLVEIIEDVRLNGIDINIKTGKQTKTNKAKIHYSKTGTHIVPFIEKGDEK